jgi:hypothetical protein
MCCMACIENEMGHEFEQSSELMPWSIMRSINILHSSSVMRPFPVMYIPTMHFCTKDEICSAACGADRWGHVVFCFIPFNKGTRETWKIKPGGLPTAKLKRKKTIYIQIETRTIDHRSKKYPSLFKSRIRRYTRVKWLG